MTENLTSKSPISGTNSKKCEPNVTLPSKSPSDSDTPSNTSTPNVFWPFTRVDPRLLHATYMATKKKQQADNFNQLGDATL